MCAFMPIRHRLPFLVVRGSDSSPLTISGSRAPLSFLVKLITDDGGVEDTALPHISLLAAKWALMASKTSRVRPWVSRTVELEKRGGMRGVHQALMHDLHAQCAGEPDRRAAAPFALGDVRLDAGDQAGPWAIASISRSNRSRRVSFFIEANSSDQKPCCTLLRLDGQS
jgi:hypothetical protein